LARDLASTTYKNRTHRDLAAYLKSGNRTDEIAAALKPTWTSATAAFAKELRRELASIQPRDKAVADRGGAAAKPQPVVIARQAPAAATTGIDHGAQPDRRFGDHLRCCVGLMSVRTPVLAERAVVADDCQRIVCTIYVGRDKAAVVELDAAAAAALAGRLLEAVSRRI
jgi:hypothetical protein